MFSTTLINSVKLLQDQQNPRPESYVSKLFKKVTMQALPLISNVSSSSFFQSRYTSSIMVHLEDLFGNFGEIEKHIPIVSEKEIPFDKIEMPISHRISQKMPFQMGCKAPPIIGGFIGTKSHRSSITSQLDLVITNLLNNSTKLDEKMTHQGLKEKTGHSIATEVEKYFAQNKETPKFEKVMAPLDEKMDVNITKSILADSIDILGAAKCVDQSSHCQSDVIQKEVSTSIVESTLKDVKQDLSMKATVAPKITEISISSKCKCSASAQRRKPKKLNAKNKQLDANCVCSKIEIKECNVTLQTNENSSTPKSGKARKNRKTKQKRKNRIKQSREQLIAGLLPIKENGEISQNRIDFKTNTGTCDEVDFKSAPDYNSWESEDEDFDFVKRLTLPLVEECDFDIVFDSGLDFRNMHSVLSHCSSADSDSSCDDTNVSFILNGNDDMLNSDSESEVGEDYSWQSFKNQFEEFQECLVVPSGSDVKPSTERGSPRIELDISSDGFEITISNIQDFDDYDPIGVTDHLTEVNRKWNEDMKDCLSTEDKICKVCFAPDEDLEEVEIIYLICEDERKSPWEQIRLDTCRFKKRIASLEPILSEILHKDHRDKIFAARFTDE